MPSWARCARTRARGEIAGRPGRHARARAHHRPTTSCTSTWRTLNVPVVAWLRDTQNYVQLAARGLTLWDVAPSRVERDLEQWLPLKDWIAR